MDNDILIDQARQLYAALLVKQSRSMPKNITVLERFERLINGAYCRYQRRLNRCATCFQHRQYDCIRLAGEKLVACKQPRSH